MAEYAWMAKDEKQGWIEVPANHKGATRYRVEHSGNVRALHHDPEPPAPPPVSDPVVIDQQRWARKGECGWWIGQPDGEPPHRDAEPVLVIVRSAAADEAMREKAADQERWANNWEAAQRDIESRDRTITTLTRERDEARAAILREQEQAGKAITLLGNENVRQASRIADLERQLAEATKPALIIDWGDSKWTLKDLHDWDIITGTGADGVPFTLTVKRGTESPAPSPPAEARMAMG